MKVVTVKNLTFQFEHENPSEKNIRDFIAAVNGHLAHEFSDSCPSIMYQEMETKDIEVHPLDALDEDEEEDLEDLEDDLEENQRVTILGHRISWNYNDANIVELPKSNYGHIEKRIKKGYREGELILNDKKRLALGSWKILARVIGV